MKVYLETSFISAYVTNRVDAASVYRRDSSREWWRTQRHHHEIFISAEVIAELADPAHQNADKALAFIAHIQRVTISEEAVGFAQILVREMVMPAPVGGDSLHVAAATIARMDYILSWNVRHLANPNKLLHLERVCLRFSLIPPKIVTPESLWENDHE